jgi:ribosomal protein L19
VHPPPPSEVEQCKEPIKLIDAQQLARLDPTGARQRMFDRTNRDRPQPGDILHVTFKAGEPFSGVIMWIKGSGPHKSVMLRSQLTGVGMEMSIKIHSPEVQSMEIVKRAAKRARRNKLTYLRKPEHDQGSVQRTVDQYLRERAQLMGKKTATTTPVIRKKRARR